VYEAVMTWIQHDAETRQSSLETLLEHVRLPLMAQEYIVQRVEEELLVKNNSRCKDFLIEAMKYHLLKPDQKAMYKSSRTVPRNPIGLPKVCIFWPDKPCVFLLSQYRDIQRCEDVLSRVLIHDRWFIACSHAARVDKEKSKWNTEFVTLLPLRDIASN
jgi:hypothetical protein